MEGGLEREREEGEASEAVGALVRSVDTRERNSGTDHRGEGRKIKAGLLHMNRPLVCDLFSTPILYTMCMEHLLCVMHCMRIYVS